MIHPSYSELMERINKDNNSNDTTLVTSRYSIVLATSKRARQLTNGSPARVKLSSGKLLSVAIDEFYEGKVHIEPENAKEYAPGDAAPAEELQTEASAENDITAQEEAAPEN